MCLKVSHFNGFFCLNLNNFSNIYFRSEPKQNACIYPGQPESTLGTFLTLLWSNLELDDVKEFIGKIVKYMSSMYREVTLLLFFNYLFLSLARFLKFVFIFPDSS